MRNEEDFFNSCETKISKIDVFADVYFLLFVLWFDTVILCSFFLSLTLLFCETVVLEKCKCKKKKNL